MRIDLTITRPPQEECYSYWDTAKEIAKVPRDENWEKTVAGLIKLHGHRQKYSVYKRMWDFHDRSDFFFQILKEKVETHKTILDEWSTGKWLPT